MMDTADGGDVSKEQLQQMMIGIVGKIHEKIKAIKNGGSGDAGGNDSGRGCYGFNKYGGGRYVEMK